MEKNENVHAGLVLIIDDEQDICFMLSNIINKKTYTPAAFVHSINDANHWLRHQHPSLIFLDNNLPDGKGVDFIPDLKKMLPDTKIVMITAYDTPGDRRIAIENGADDFIGKPFSRKSIYSVVDKFLH